MKFDLYSVFWYLILILMCYWSYVSYHNYKLVDEIIERFYEKR